MKKKNKESTHSVLSVTPAKAAKLFPGLRTFQRTVGFLICLDGDNDENPNLYNFFLHCVCVCLCVSVCCMYVSHIHQSACLEVREQSLVSALAFHLLWNMVSSFLLPWTAHKLAFWLLGILPPLTPISLEEHWSAGSTGHVTVGGSFLGLQGFKLRFLCVHSKCRTCWDFSLTLM